MWRNLIFPSNVIVVDICEFCLASSRSPFFRVTSFEFFFGEWSLPISQQCGLDEFKSLPTVGLTNHSILFPETHLIQRYAYEADQPGQWDSGQGPMLTPPDNGTPGPGLGRQHSSVGWLLATSATARKVSEISLTEKTELRNRERRREAEGYK